METSVTREDCLKILDRFTNDKLTFISYEVLPLGDEPLGFLGEHSRLQITVNASKKEKVLNFFMKTIPNGTDSHRNYVIQCGVFEKEALLYKELFSKLQICIEEKFSPKCYLVSIQSHIVLEDLSLNGYLVLKHKSQTLDFAHSKCLTETLARFHVASIIFEEQNSRDNQPFRLIDHYKHMLFETTFSYKEGHPRNDWLKVTTETLINICKKIDEFKHINTEKQIYDIVDRMKDYIRPSKKYRNVINHGDLWSNNIMFKYADTGSPEHCVLVDYQMARYVPPAFDFLTFLFLTTTQEFHEANFKSLADIYHSTFAQELKIHNIDPDQILTKDEFFESCKYYKSASLLESAMFGTIVYLNPDFSKDMISDPDKFDEFMLTGRSKLVCRLFDEDEIYRNRLKSVMFQLLNNIL